jgi:hypothetical protein
MFLIINVIHNIHFIYYGINATVPIAILLYIGEFSLFV